MHPNTKYSSFSMFFPFVIMLLVVATFACNPSTEVVSATSTTAIALPTEPLPEQTATLTATLTLEPTATPAGEQYAWNNLAEVESAGISIQIARLVISDKLALAKDAPTDPIFQEMPVVAQIIFIVKNAGDEMLLVFPAHATVHTASESFFLEEFPFFVGDVVTGGVQPGETKVGGYWFGFRQTPIEEIQLLSISFAAPVKYGDPLLEPQGSDFAFDLDLSQRRRDPVPEELKDLKSFQ